MVPSSEKARSFAATVVLAATTSFVGVHSAASCAAQSVGEWRPVAVAQAPPARTGFSLAPTQSGKLLLFGGDVGNPSATEWLWDGIEWQPTTTPIPRRMNAALGASPFGGIVFGGTDAGGFLTDTWREINGTWLQLNPVTSPGVLLDMSITYDADQARMVLVGQSQGGIWQTWFYGFSGNWVAGPVFSASAAKVVADTVRGEVILLTGGFPLVEVSRLQAAAWTVIGQSPQRLSIAEAAFDPDRARAVLLQSYDTREAVEWDGLEFAGQFNPTGAFVSSTRTEIAFHAVRRETVLVANYSGSVELFRWVADATPMAVPYGAACQDPSFALRLVVGDSPQPGASHRLEAFGASGSFATISVLGFSHTQNAGMPLPQPIPTGSGSCDLRVEAAVAVVLGVGLPQSQLVSLPNSAALLGERYDAQFVQFDATGVIDSSNGLEVQIGLPLPENALVEDFASSANRDARASGDTWGGGLIQPTSIGGDGRHGSFDPTFGVQVEPGVYRWNTSGQLIPGSATLNGLSTTVTDGRFFFTDLIVPAGVTVRFVGDAAAQLFVRGRVDVQGAIRVDAADMPFAIPASGSAQGERVSTFSARQSPGGLGQVGGGGGAGGGRGGNGGRECLNQGPILLGNVNLTDGQPGEDVQVSAAHAYAASAPDTGGRGSLMEPQSGVSPNLPSAQLISFIYLPFLSTGGGGGGYANVGSQPIVPTIGGSAPLITSPTASGGGMFSVLPYPASPPAGYSSLEHFSVGGSGGGGGGSHGFGLFGFASSQERWMAGHAGSGGGGVLALRAGGDLEVSGLLSSRGGAGVVINGDDPLSTPVNTVNGISSPGGGGSGGSLLLQSGGDIQVSGQLDTGGGDGSRNDLISTPLLQIQGQAGAGSLGYYRLESNGAATFSGSAVPAFSSANNRGPLVDRDDVTGSRSRWLLPAATSLPHYLRYEMLVDINGLPVLFSDDPSVSPLAADDPAGAALLRFQGARADTLTGQPAPGTEGPWRSMIVPGSDSLNRDRANTLRFDLLLNKAIGQVRVRELRIIWR